MHSQVMTTRASAKRTCAPMYIQERLLTNTTFAKTKGQGNGAVYLRHLHVCVCSRVVVQVMRVHGSNFCGAVSTIGTSSRRYIDRSRTACIYKIVACVYVLGHTHVSHVCNDKTEVLLAYSFGFWWAAVGIVTHAYVSSIMFMLVMHTFSTFSRDCCVWTKTHETTDKCLISATCQLFILCLDSITLSTRWWWC
jgi:hypothetical protein